MVPIPFWGAGKVVEHAYTNAFENVFREPGAGYHASYGPTFLPPHTDGTFLPDPPRAKVRGTYCPSTALALP